MTGENLEPGTVIGQRYRVERFLGQGGLGRVYVCKDLSAGWGRVALKVLVSTEPGQEEVEALREEFSLLSRVKHPCLVRILDFGFLEESRAPYLVEEYVEGKNLLEATASSDREKVVQLMVELCRVVQYLHTRGMVHGDLKPSNVLVSETQGHLAVKVLDFGLTRCVSSGWRERGVGTLGYASPEVLMGKAGDPRSDLYSLGVVSYQLLVRRLPFEDEDPGFLVQKQIHAQADMRALERMEKGGGLAQVVRSLLEKEPEKRPQSAEEVIRLLSVATGHDYTRVPTKWMESYFTAGRLVGRSQEMSLLRDRAEQVKASGRGWTVFLTGESGAGKTRCMEELRIWALLAGWPVVEGRCVRTEERSYGAYRQILGHLDGSGNNEVVPRFDHVSRLGDTSFEHSAETAAGQFRDQLTRAIVRRLTGRPTVLLLHDFHWADEATTAVLDYLISDIAAHPIFLCVSARGGDGTGGPLGKVINQAIRQSRGEVLALEGLPAESVPELIGSLTGASELGPAMGPWVHRASGGNPFFIEEILKHLVDRGLLRSEQGKWKLEEEAFRGLEVPASVAVVLRHRLRQLSESARELAGWLAVYNRAVSKDELRAAAQDGHYDEALEELVFRQMIRSSGTRVEEKIEFCHALISEVILEDLPVKRRRRMHQKISDVLEERYGESAHLQELAVHCMEGNGGEKAVRYAMKAAAECQAEFANDLALRFYEYILARRDALSAEELCRVAMDAAEACCALGIPKRGVKLLRCVLDSASVRDSKFLKARLLVQLSRAYQFLGDLIPSETAARNGFELINSDRECASLENIVIRAQLLCQLGFCESNKSRPREGLKMVNTALDLIKGMHDPMRSGYLYTVRAGFCWIACDFHEGYRAGTLAVGILEPIGAIHLLPMAHSHLGLNLTALGRFYAALPHLDRAVELGKTVRSLAPQVQALSNSAECYCRSGEFERASQICRELLRVAGETGNKNLEFAANVSLLEIKITTGDYISASGILNLLKSYDHSSLPFYTRAQVLFQSALLKAEFGQNRESLRDLARLRLLRSSEAPVYEIEAGEILRAKILHRQGKTRKAIQLLKDLNSVLIRKRLAYQLCILKIALGEVLFEAGDLTCAKHCAGGALRLARAMPAPHLEAEALLLTARIGCFSVELGNINSSGVPGCLEGPERSTLAQVRSALAKTISLAESMDLDQISIRAHLELSRLEELDRNHDRALIHAKVAQGRLKLLESRVPPEMISSFWLVRGRAQWKCHFEQLTDKLSTIDPKGEIDIGGMQEQHLRILLRISNVVNRIRDLDSLLESVVDLLIRAMGMERALVFLKESSSGKLYLAKGRNVKQESLPRAEAISTSILDDAHRGRPFVTANARTDLRVAQKDSVISFQLGALLCAPLRTGGRIIGVLYSDHPSPVADLSESLINLFEAFCSLVAVAVDNALAHQKLVQEKTELEQYVRHAREGYTEIVGKSSGVQLLRERIRQVASSPLDVLILGESGTGKELVARAIHRTGRRASGTFIPLDCGSLSDSLVESELFGYRKGAFTGAVENRPGLLEAASGGVIFLDEISNLPLRLQSKLLRVLQEREVRRIGEVVQRKIDVQVIAATNSDMRQEIRKSRFRKDLYYRLNAMEIQVPPLRERPEDIPLLLQWFLSKTAQLEGGKAKGFSAEAMDLLTHDSYPGNVRELRNIVQSSYYLAPGSVIGVEHLPTDVRKRGLKCEGHDGIESSGWDLYRRIRGGKGSFEDLVKKPFLQRRFGSKVVRQVMEKALAETGGKYRDAFRLLKIPDRQYSTMMLFLKRNGCYLDFRPFRHNSQTGRPNS